ncbi:hypothetical protein MNBD_UNCLBAC01-2086 [hydrothermal vent metagenome]|uniref:Uncharacterized protein n=1 Tax=hydrothermal vent metagenome TaxID=652676 RepID=A0A3B1DPK1_9ZZZZ
MAMIDLISGGIQHSNIFMHMPLFDEIYYEGLTDDKVHKYKAIREDQACKIHVLSVIRKDEDIIWEALRDLVKRSVAQAAVSVRGVFSFDLLTTDIHKEIKKFDVTELITLIINCSQRLKPGEQSLIKYSSFYGLFRKLLHEDWGKIAVKTTIEVFKDKPSYLDLLIKRLIKKFEFSHEPGILLLNDLSMNPLFDVLDDLQQERLNKLIEKQFTKAIEFPPEVYVQDKNGARELLSGSVL